MLKSNYVVVLIFTNNFLGGGRTWNMEKNKANYNSLPLLHLAGGELLAK